MSDPLCVHRNGMKCESCNELNEIEAQLEELHERHRQARVKQNYIHSPLIHQFPFEIVSAIFTLAERRAVGVRLSLPRKNLVH